MDTRGFARLFLLILVIVSLASTGCDRCDEDECVASCVEDGYVTGGCDLHECECIWGADGDADGDTDADADGDGEGDGDADSDVTCPQVEPSPPRGLHEEMGSERNGADDPRYEQLDDRRGQALVRGPCGTVGLLFRAPTSVSDPESSALVYVDLTASDGSAPEVVMYRPRQESLFAFPWSLGFDDDCHPLVMVSDRSEGYLQYSPGDDGWAETAVPFGLGDGLSNVEHRSVIRGRDGALHLFARATLDGSDVLIHGVYGGSSWIFESLPAPETGYERWYTFKEEFQVDGAGRVHAIYNRDRELYYGLLEDGSWSSEVVQAQENFDTEAAFDASLALDSVDRPAVAAAYVQRVPTGSLQLAELRYHTRVDDGWTFETLATEADGYVGGDGNRYTGDRPHLVFDGDDRAHIVFNDIASWHSSEGWNEHASGQIRYAREVEGGFCLFTLYEQVGQSESPDELIDLLYPSLVVEPDGSSITVAGVERFTHGPTLLYDLEVELTHRALALTATITE